MKSMDLVKSILQTWPGCSSLKSVINLVNEIIQEHGEDDLVEGKTVNPCSTFFDREIELEYNQRFFCDNCSGDDRWCHLCGGTGQTAPAQKRYLRIWLSEANGGELCWG